MARWEPDSRGRLEQAALALYGERGFENTTVAEIAERRRTDRANVLPVLRRQAGGAVLGRGRAAGASRGRRRRRAADSAAPIDAVAAALDAAGALLQERREFARQRQTVIAANTELRERELIKLASLASALADALRRRGATEPAATLTAEAGIAVFKVAFERWVDESNELDLPRSSESRSTR